MSSQIDVLFRAMRGLIRMDLLLSLLGKWDGCDSLTSRASNSAGHNEFSFIVKS